MGVNVAATGFLVTTSSPFSHPPDQIFHVEYTTWKRGVARTHRGIHMTENDAATQDNAAEGMAAMMAAWNIQSPATSAKEEAADSES